MSLFPEAPDAPDTYDAWPDLIDRPRPHGKVRPKPQRLPRRHVVSSLDPPIYRSRGHEIVEVGRPPTPTQDDEPRRWSRPLTALGLSGAVAVAWLVLVTFRLARAASDGTGAGGAGGAIAARLQEAVSLTLLADRALSVVQWLTTVTTTLVLGGVIYHLFVARPIGSTSRTTALRVMRSAAVVGTMTTLASVLPRAMAVSGRGLTATWDVDVLGFVLASRFGDAALLRLAGLVLLLRVALSDDASASRHLERSAGVAGGALVLAAFVLVGHAQASTPAPLLVPLHVVHVVAVSTWFGGVTFLALELRRLKREGTAAQLAAVVGRFSHLAMATVAAAGASGLVLAGSQLAAPGEILSTAYGRALAAKLVVLALPLALGGYNARRLVPALARESETGAWKRLRSTMAVEAVVIAVGVLLFTVAMTTGGL